MSISMTTYFQKEKMPKPEDIINELSKLGYAVRLFEEPDLITQNGYLPMMLNGYQTGFEYSYHEEYTAQDINEHIEMFELGDNEAKHILSKNYTASVHNTTHSNLYELIASCLFVAVIAKLSGGIIFNSEVGIETCEKFLSDTIQTYDDFKAEWAQVIVAINDNDVEKVKQLIRYVNLAGGHGMEALDLAAKSQNREMVVLLLENHAYMNPESHYRDYITTIYDELQHPKRQSSRRSISDMLRKLKNVVSA